MPIRPNRAAVPDALRTDPVLRLRPLLRREFDQLVADGCFEGERIELLRGALVEMTPQYPQHAGRVQSLGRFFSSRCATAPKDLGIKAGIYAEATVTEYWVLDLPNVCVHVHRRPSAIGYEEVRVIRPGERLTLVAFPDVEIEVEALVG